MRLKLSLLLIFAFSLKLSASRVSETVADSLERVLKAALPDTQRVKVLINLIGFYNYDNHPQAYLYAKQAMEIAEKLGLPKFQGVANYAMGNYYYFMEDYDEALAYYHQALKFYEGINDKERIASVLLHVGLVHSENKQYKEALQHYQRALELNEQVNDKQGVAMCLGNMAMLYNDMGDPDKSIECHEKSLKIFESLKGTIPDEDVYTGMGNCLTDIGIVYYYTSKFERALYYFKLGYVARLKTADLRGHAGSLINIGKAYTQLGDYDLGVENLNNGLLLAEQLKYREFQAIAHSSLYDCYKKQGMFEKSNYHLERMVTIKDSLSDENNSKQISEMEVKYQTEKKAKQIEVQSAQIERKQTIIYFTIGVSILILGLLLLMYNRYQIKQRSHHLLEEQNKIIAEKKKEIQDSINYALQIQRALLPDPKRIFNAFPQCFGLYLPKDVVSGDFFWHADLDGKSLIAAADCTGHGVPGGFMSMIGMDKLNHAVLERHLTKPSDILTSTNKGLKSALRQDEATSTSRDGMDIALCTFDFENMKLEFAGANRPLFHIRNGVLTETSPTKAAIGGPTSFSQEFTNHVIDLQKGDTIYIFTDGYVDQFGGEDGKKFMSKKFKNILLSMQDKKMEDQEAILLKNIIEWQGNREQVDDILIIGIRV